MLPTSAGIEPATSWSPVGRASNCATEAGIKSVKVTGVQNIHVGQGHQVKVPAKSVHREEALYKIWWLKALQLRTYGRTHKRCKSEWSVKYRSRSPSQGTCGGRTLRRSTMWGLMIVGLIVEELLNVDVKCVKGTGAQNIGQGHRVKIPAKSVHLGEALCKVWWLEV